MTTSVIKPVDEAQKSDKNNKFHLINTVLVSSLAGGDKALLIELIMRWNQQTGQTNPGVERLCKAKGIKNAKNFKGVDKYLPGLVAVKKTKGMRNSYILNLDAIVALPAMEVNTDKYTTQNPPADEGYSEETPLLVQGTPPSGAGYYPPSREGDYSPSDEGSDISVDSSMNNSNIYKGIVVQTEINQGFSSGESIGAPRLDIPVSLSSGDAIGAAAPLEENSSNSENSAVMHSIPAQRGTPTFDLDSLSDEEVLALSPDFIRTLRGNTMYATGQRKARIQNRMKQDKQLAAMADNKAFLAEQEESSNG
ncbi:hypothetical protein [Streptomyces sp. NPDC091217]|uniref:hypothetical protein n=1 Tax=Streptomyces sp. NPDC091217 TaxID=3365975 RepID=UPI0038119B25